MKKIIKPGRTARADVEPIIKEILKGQNITPTEIKRRFEKKTNTTIAYATIIRNLKIMVKMGVIKKMISNKTAKRITAIYALK